MLENPQAEISLYELNEKFKSWLYKEYQHRVHSSLEVTPHDSYTSGMEKVHIRRANPDQIDNAFLHTLTRKVSGDALVSINKRKYEVPGKFIKQEITIYSKASLPGIYYIYEDGIEEPHRIREVDPIANSRFNK